MNTKLNSTRRVGRPSSTGLRAMAVMLCAGLGLALGGCTTQQNYDQLVDTNRSLKDRNEELRRANQELTTENQLLQRQRSANESALSELNRVNSALRQQLESAGIRLASFDSELRNLQFASLDPETDRALTALAAKYPDIIRYDSSRGMLRFASDLTFASGSDQVQPAAQKSLEALADILKSSAAAPYEVMILGHTDSQPISAGTARRHPTNMHLSAHRAISVRAALASMGVSADRMYAAGWGEHRPAVANTATGNTPANRRVEIYLTRASGDFKADPVRTATPTGAAVDREPDMTK